MQAAWLQRKFLVPVRGSGEIQANTVAASIGGY